jgi:3-deoxy-D-arabino-heptulosonate 7-phosphate (DAHP) synthase class II
VILSPGHRRAVDAALSHPAEQQPDWPNPGQAAGVRAVLELLPPVTMIADTDLLAVQLAEAARGRAFVMQGGDCAETFAGNTRQHIRGLADLLRGMSAVLSANTASPVVAIARMAGQFAKPRSAAVDAHGLPVYRGDIVNSSSPVPTLRTPDPSRMLKGYAHARFTIDVLGRPAAAGIFVSHEALLLDYERALLRSSGGNDDQGLYGLSAHFLWIGERTRQLDGAHIALATLLRNPIGVKIGPGTSPELAVEYVERLDPRGEAGHLTLISRMGCQKVREMLPPIVEKVTASGHQVVWQCDPMHGNTRTSPAGRKTRHFDQIIAEIDGFFEVHRRLGTHPGGIHLEMTSDDVTECLGGTRGISEQDLETRYETACDPRLNAEQAMELIHALAEKMRVPEPGCRTATRPECET